MSKENTAKILLIAGAAALIGYMAVNQGIADKIKNALAGLGTGGGGLGFGDITFPAISLPAFNLALPQLDSALDKCGLGDLFASMTNKGTGNGSSQLPTDHTTVTDVVYSMPWWGKGVIGVSAGILGAYGGFKIMQAASPLLKQIGIQAAKGTGGMGSFLNNIFRNLANKFKPIKSTDITLPPIGGVGFMSPIGPILGLMDMPEVTDFMNRLLPNMALKQAQGGTPASVAPSGIIPALVPSFIMPSVATRTTPLAAMPSISPNAIASIGWRQVRQPSVTIAGKTYGIFTAPGTQVPAYKPVD